MSSSKGVNNFISARNVQRQPTPVQASRQELAQNAKVGPKKSRTVSNSQTTMNMNENFNTDPNPTRNPLYGQQMQPPRRSTPIQTSYPVHAHTQPIDIHGRDTFDTSTVNSDFDQTMSEEHYRNAQHGGQAEEAYQPDEGDLMRFNRHMDNNGSQNGDGAYDDNIDPAHDPYESHNQALHKRTRTAVLIGDPGHEQRQASPTRRKGGIAGRFAQPEGVRIESPLAQRSINAIKDNESSKKRAHSEDVGVPPVIKHLTQTAMQIGKEELAGGKPQGPTAGADAEISRTSSRQLEADRDSDEEYTDDTHSIAPHEPRLQSRPIGQQDRQQGRDSEGQSFDLALVEPDYNDGVLRQMQYAELRDQSFETVPQAPELRDHDESISNLAMNQRVAHHVNKLHEAEDDQAISEKRAAMAELFGNMSLDEWEEAGDWFLARFGDVVKKLRDARRAKRQTVAHFERVLEQREEAVQGSLAAFSDEMTRMKKGARTVIEGKKL